MFNKTVATDPTELDLAIARLLQDMQEKDTHSDDYEKIVDQLVKLQNLNDANRPQKMSPDAKAAMIANLAGITAILLHERTGVLASKAVAFVQKLR